MIPPPTRFFERIPLRWQWAIALTLLAGGVVYAFWWMRLLIRPWCDFAFVYAAGRSWVQGFSPYDFERWDAEWAAIRPVETIVTQPMPFMYPPYWGPIAVALAAVPWPLAIRAWDAVNVFTLAGTCWLALEMLGTREGYFRKPAVWVFVAVALLNPAVRYAVFQSQMTIVSAFGVVGAFWALYRKKTAWLAFFAFIAALKPQLGGLPLLYLFLNGGHIGLALAGVGAVVLGVVSLLPSHIERFPTQLAHCYALHMQIEFNQPKEFFNLPVLAARYVSGSQFMLAGPVLAVIAVIVMTWMRQRGHGTVLHDALWQASLISAITCALMPLHGYDLVLFTPLAILCYRLRSTWLVLFVVSFIFVAGRPGIFAAYLHVPVAAPLLTLGLAVVVMFAASRYGGAPSAAQDVAPNTK